MNNIKMPVFILGFGIALMFGDLAHAGDLCQPVEDINGAQLPKPDPALDWEFDSVMVANVGVESFGNSVYVVCYYSCRIVRFERDAQSGKLTYKDSLLMPTKQKWTSAAIAFKKLAKGGAMYLSIFKPVHALYWYSVDESGKLTEKAQVVDGAVGSPLLSPDGKFLYAFGEKKIFVFSLNETTGEPTKIDELDGVGACTAAIAPDGKQIYATNNDGKVNIFNVGGDGKLKSAGTFDLQVSAYNVDGCTTVSPDGKHVYVSTGPKGKSQLIILNRDAATGALSKGSTKPPPAEFSWIKSIVFNPDGKSGYLTDRGSGQLAAFKRDPVSGEFEIVDKFKKGTGNWMGLSLDPSVGALYGVCFDCNSKTSLHVFKTPPAQK